MSKKLLSVAQGKYRCFVDVCCNNPDTGLPAGKVAGLQFGLLGEDVLSLELHVVAAEPRFTELGDFRVRFGRRVFRISGCQEHFGNWCWNRYLVPLKEWRRWLNFVRSMKCGPHPLFSVTEGNAEFFAWWVNGKDLPEGKVKKKGI